MAEKLDLDALERSIESSPMHWLDRETTLAVIRYAQELEATGKQGEKPVGYAVGMPGTKNGFTMVVFDGDTVPVGTAVYLKSLITEQPAKSDSQKPIAMSDDDQMNGSDRSVAVNRITWKLAEAMGRIPAGAERVELDIAEVVNASCAILAQQPAKSEVPTGEREAFGKQGVGVLDWFPYLSDRADGCRGHYAIARKNPTKSFPEYLCPKGNWVGWGAKVFSLEEACAMMRDLLSNDTGASAPDFSNGYRKGYDDGGA